MGGMESKQVVSSTTSTPLENIKRILFVAVVILCTFFSAEAQRVRRVTRCSFVNRCSYVNAVAGRRCASSARYCTRSQPIYGRYCARYSRRCTAYNYRNVVSCARYSTRCVQNQRYCSRSARYCTKYQPIYKFYCSRYGTRCVKNQVIRRQICTKHAAHKQCIKYRNVTTKFCRATRTQCGAYKNVSVSVCNRMGKKCTKASSSRVCTRRAKYCAQFKRTTQRYCKKTTLSGKCVSWRTFASKVCSRYANQCVKYRTVKRRVCKRTGNHCVKRAKSVRSCAKYSYKVVNKGRVCARYNPRKVIKKGTCLKTANRRVCVDTQVCVRTHFRGTKVVKTEKSKSKCLKYKTVKRCVSKATKTIVKPRTCAAWRARTVRVKYCSKYVNRPGRCLKSVRRCIQYATTSSRTCAKYQKRCAAYRTVKRRLCARKAPRCVQYATRTLSRCVRYGTKCTAYKTVTRCHRYAKVCTSRGIKIHRRCARLVKVCAVHGSTTRRVCDRYRNTSRCVKYRTLVQTRCAKSQRYCVRNSKRVVGKRCIRTGIRCVAYGNRCVRQQRYCSSPVRRRIRSTCRSYQSYCAAYGNRRTGTRCVSYGTRCTRYVNTYARRRVCRRTRICRVVLVRGDPHVTTVEGKDENTQFTGVFSYYRHKNLWIQVRFSRRHGGAVVSGVAVLNKNKNGWGVNYKAAVTKARKLRVHLGKNKELKKGEEYVVKTSHGNLLVFFDKLTASISIEFKAKHGDGEGLVHNHKHFAKFVVKKKDSRLGKNFKYEKFTPKVHKRFAALAKAECEKNKYGVKLSERAVKDCKFDVMVTGERFGRLYAKFERDVDRGDVDKAK